MIVAWAWPPIGRVGAMRPMGFAREWVKAGLDVHVLTGPGDRGGEYTPDLLPIAEETGAHVHRAAAPGIPRPERLVPAYVDPPPPVRVPISRARQIAGQWRGFPDGARSWIRPAAALALQLHRQEPFDIVWTTSPPESVHFVGRALAQAGVPWIADFRDQWSDYLLARWDPVSRWIIDGLTRKMLGPAWAVTAATEGVAASLARARGRSVLCVRNGFDREAAGDVPVRARVLGYFGRIDPEMQHPDRLWPALRTLRDRGEPWRMEIFAVPGGGGGAEVRPPPDLGDHVFIHAPVPHEEALRRMEAMAALLVLAWETRGGETTVAAKLYEYVGSGRPVLVCAPDGFEARTLVERTGTGVGAWTTEELAAALEGLVSYDVNPHGRASLSRAHAARELIALFEAAGKRGRAAR